MTRPDVGALVCAALASCGGGPETTRVVVTSAEGTALDVAATVATTAAERRRGLQGSPPLAPGEGLLLAFPVEGEVCIFNSDVEFDIDAVYAAADGAVIAVERDIPAGDPAARCYTPVENVLEVAAGAAGAVAVGDSLEVR